MTPQGKGVGGDDPGEPGERRPFRSSGPDECQTQGNSPGIPPPVPESEWVSCGLLPVEAFRSGQVGLQGSSNARRAGRACGMMASNGCSGAERYPAIPS
jgi:hypothetical protein